MKSCAPEVRALRAETRVLPVANGDGIGPIELTVPTASAAPKPPQPFLPEQLNGERAGAPWDSAVRPKNGGW
jgi:hypothetical protein